MIFNWKPDKRFNPQISDPDFLPVAIVPEPVADIPASPKIEALPGRSAPGTLEIMLPCRSRIFCHGDVDPGLFRDVLANLCGTS